MSTQQKPDYHDFELPYQNSGFDAELAHTRRQRPSCCACACCLGCLGFLLLIVAAFVGTWYCFFTGGAPLTISPETTIIVGPLKQDGAVDFHEAIQEKIKQGAQPNENGFRDIVLGYGQAVFAEDRNFLETALLYFEELGIDPETEPTLFLVPLELEAPEQWLNIVGEGLDAVQTAAAKPHYFVPLVRKSERDFVVMSQPLSVYAFHAKLSNALWLRAFLRFQEEDGVDDAWKDIHASLRLFRHVTINQAWHHALASRNVESLLTPVAEVVRTFPLWTSEQLEQTIEDLESLPVWQDRQTTLTIMQFQILDMLSSADDLSELMDRFAGGEQENPMQHAFLPVTFDWNAVAKALNHEIEVYGELLEKSAERSLEERLELLSLHQGEVPIFIRLSDVNTWDDFLSLAHYFEEKGENSLLVSGRSKLAGTIAGELVTWAAGELYRLQVMEESRCEALRLALALERFHRERGHYPDELEELPLRPAVPNLEFEYRNLGDGYHLLNPVFLLEKIQGE